MITKTAINAAMKANFNFDKVRVDSDLAIDGKGKPVRVNGSFIPAVYAWSHSPMDVTTVGMENARARFRQVFNVIKDLEGVTLRDDFGDLALFTANAGTPKEFFISLALYRHQKYSGLRRMDPGYQNSWVTVKYRDEY